MKEYKILVIPLASVTRSGLDLYWRHEEEKKSAIAIEKALYQLARVLSGIVPGDMVDACNIMSMKMVDGRKNEVSIAITLFSSEDLADAKIEGFMSLVTLRIRDACNILEKIAEFEHPERISVAGGSGSTIVTSALVKVPYGVDMIVSCLRGLRPARGMRIIPATLGEDELLIPAQSMRSEWIDDAETVTDTIRVRGVLEQKRIARIEFENGRTREMSYDPSVEHSLLQAQYYRRAVEIIWEKSYQWARGTRVDAGGVIVRVAPDPQLELDECLIRNMN